MLSECLFVPRVCSLRSACAFRVYVFVRTACVFVRTACVFVAFRVCVRCVPRVFVLFLFMLRSACAFRVLRSRSRVAFRMLRSRVRSACCVPRVALACAFAEMRRGILFHACAFEYGHFVSRVCVRIQHKG
jgi:hypothetical protein